MDNIVSEIGGERRFSRISRWNAIDYTIISKNNRFAKYADSKDFGKDKLALTYFKLRNITYPLDMFVKLSEPIYLEDRTVLSRQNDKNEIYYLEISPNKDKVRLYVEVT